MTARHYRTIPGCPVEVTLDLIDGRWKGVVLHHLMDGETLRFSQLHRRLPGITPRLLTKQLRDLETAGLVTRTVHAEVPPRVEYRLTEDGESLRPLIEFAESWGRIRMAKMAETMGGTAIT